MLDTNLQTRFSRSCTDAAFGYAAATTAAYADFADQVLSFWTDALQPEKRSAAPKAPAFNPFWPVPMAQAGSTPMPNPFAMMAEMWMPPPPTTRTRPSSTPAFPFAPWFGAFPFNPFAPSPTVWPMAAMMMGAGVPRTVAWPTAEANAAMLDAADAMATSVKQATSSYQSQGGHAVAPTWPPSEMMMLAAFVPFNISTMFNAFRFS